MAEAGSLWHGHWKAAAEHPGFLDLIDSRFHHNGLLPPEHVFREEFERWLTTRRYEPDSKGDARAREAVAAFYRGVGADVSADHVVLTAGTSEAYSLVFTHLGRPGDAVALPRPGYPLFEHLADAARLATWTYDQPLIPSGPVPQALRFLVAISPNNPTGRVYSAQDWSLVGDFCRRHDLVLICDEVFDAFVAEGVHLDRPAALLPDVKTITLNGISKRFGSPDLKLAWLAVTGPDDWRARTLAQLEFANDLYLSANSFSQALLPRLFGELGAWQGQVRATLDGNRQALNAWLDEHPDVVAPPTQGGIHGLLRWPGLPRGWDDERWSIALLERQRLGLHPGYLYDVQEPGTLVYSLLKRPLEFQEGLGRLSSAWRDLVASR